MLSHVSRNHSPKQTDHVIHLPEDYIGKKVEIIAFSMEEEELEAPDNKDFSNTFRSIKFSTKGFKFNREEANER